MKKFNLIMQMLIRFCVKINNEDLFNELDVIDEEKHRFVKKMLYFEVVS